MKEPLELAMKQQITGSPCVMIKDELCRRDRRDPAFTRFNQDSCKFRPKTAQNAAEVAGQALMLLECQL